MALINTTSEIENLISTLDDSQKIGAKIVLKSLEEPLRQICNNCGIEPAVILQKIKQENNGIGFDINNKTFVNMKEAGIIDPTKVTRSALENAASVASMVLTTEGIIANNSENKNIENMDFEK